MFKKDYIEILLNCELLDLNYKDLKKLKKEELKELLEQYEEYEEEFLNYLYL